MNSIFSPGAGADHVYGGNSSRPCQSGWQRLKWVPLFLFFIGVLAYWASPILCKAQAETPLNLTGTLLPVTSTTTLLYWPTFETLGYNEVVLESPIAQEEYIFRLPKSWRVIDDSYLELKFSYFFTRLEQPEGAELSGFGQLSVSMDGTLLAVYVLDAAALERQSLRVDFPPELLNKQPGQRHEIIVALDAWFLCDAAHKGELIVHPDSTLFLSYILTPPVLDLADYPSPFSQNAFDLDYVRFILPAQPSEAELRTATTVAAGLGDLAGSNMVISATTDADWLRLVEAGQTTADHLFVIGQPDRNHFIPWLGENEAISLPVSIHHRTWGLSTLGPKAVIPGDTFTYVLNVTNTMVARTRALTLTNYLPYLTDLVSCDPECIESPIAEGINAAVPMGSDDQHTVSWPLPLLALGEHTTFSITLRLRDIQSLSSTFPLLENMAVLVDETPMPVNMSSLSTRAGNESIKELVASSVQSDYFFTRDGYPVAESDGILQEILSPWDSQQAILMITGLSDEAVHKAAHALGLDAGLPDMEGPAALIREVQPSPPVTETWSADFTLDDLGYGDRIGYGIYPRSPSLDYWFDVPRGWYYTNESYLSLHFAYSGAIDVQNSSLTVLLNNDPLSTIPFSQISTTEQSLRFAIPGTMFSPGASNKLSIQSNLHIASSNECQNFDFTQAWVKVFEDSQLHLGVRAEERVDVLALSYFPSPFDERPDLSNLLFVLPSDPGATEVESLLLMAARLGRSTKFEEANASVSLGTPPDILLQNHHIIAIGRPTRNPWFQDFNTLLPQPFIPSTDKVENRIGEVILRLPPDLLLGYVQELPSPWNEALSLLVVTGTRDEAVTWAAYMLNRQSSRFRGNLALVREGAAGMEVHSLDTRRLTSSGQETALLTAVPELTPATATPTATLALDGEVNNSSITPTLTVTPAGERLSNTTVGEGLPVWVTIFIGVTGVTVIVIFALVLWRLRRR